MSQKIDTSGSLVDLPAASRFEQIRYLQQTSNITVDVPLDWSQWRQLWITAGATGQTQFSLEEIGGNNAFTSRGQKWDSSNGFDWHNSDRSGRFHWWNGNTGGYSTLWLTTSSSHPSWWGAELSIGRQSGDYLWFGHLEFNGTHCRIEMRGSETKTFALHGLRAP